MVTLLVVVFLHGVPGDLIGRLPYQVFLHSVAGGLIGMVTSPVVFFYTLYLVV